MEPATPSAPPRLRFFRAFLPFWIVALFGALVLSVRYYLRHPPGISALVSVDYGKPLQGYVIEVEGEVYRPLERIRLGPKTITFSAPDTETEIRSVFIWPGENALGDVNLRRKRGDLELVVLPPPKSVELQSEFAGFTTESGILTNIQAGEYTVFYEYPNLRVTNRIRVVGNQRNYVIITNPVGALELKSTEPAEFVLKGARKEWNGTFPRSFPALSAESYLLTTKRGDYALRRNIRIEAATTNRVEIEFVYGAIEVTSEPPGAEVIVGAKKVGSTPLLLSKIIPDTYRIDLVKPGFDPVALEIEVQGTNVAKAHRILVNTSYRVAMSQVREARDANQYRRALRALETALRAAPDSGEATALLSETKARALQEEAAELLERRDIARCLNLLDEADKLEAGNEVSSALREKAREIEIEIAKERSESDRRAIEEAKRVAGERGQRFITEAKGAIQRGNLDDARTSLAQAKLLVPSDAAIPGIESEIKAAEEKREAQLAEVRLQEQIRERRRELDAVFSRAIGADPNQALASAVWICGKSAAEVQYAAEPKEGKGIAMSEAMRHNENLFTWKSGRALPIVGGTYYRFGAVNLAPGLTEIRVRLYHVSSTQGNPASQSQADMIARRMRDIRKAVSDALGGDLRDP